MEDLFLLNATTLAALGGLLGALTGVISWLLRRLLRTKDQQLGDLQASTAKAEDALVKDRDYWRETAMRLLEHADASHK